jgi:hypothetical protein
MPKEQIKKHSEVTGHCVFEIIEKKVKKEDITEEMKKIRELIEHGRPSSTPNENKPNKEHL